MWRFIPFVLLQSKWVSPNNQAPFTVPASGRAECCGFSSSLSALETAEFLCAPISGSHFRV